MEEEKVPVIDTHVHFWKYDKARDTWMDKMKTLQQDYLPHTLAGTLQRNGVDACVAVQADSSELETHFLVELSKSHSFIKGVVGWVDLLGENVEERLDYFSQYAIIKGYRHVVQAEPDGFLLRPDFQRGISALAKYDYAYDILVYHHQLSSVLELVKAFPDQQFIIDHCGKPAIGEKKLDEWATYIRKIAQHPKVYCKLSGLFTEAKWKEWSPAEFYPYFDVVFDAFGTDRLLFGSDWPVILVSGMYVQWKSMLEKYMEEMTVADKEKVFGSNAIDFYKLSL